MTKDIGLITRKEINEKTSEFPSKSGDSPIFY